MNLKDYIKATNKASLTCLSIACGCGELERGFFQKGYFSTIHGCDISFESIEIAKQKADQLNHNGAITYSVIDCNSQPFSGKYDVIVAKSCVHHIERLEFFFNNVKQALNPGGLFIQAEYVGPTRFQHSRFLIGGVNLLLRLLPKNHRNRSKYKRLKMVDVMKDPSEAVRSDEIIPLTKKYFPQTKVIKHKGIAIHLLYQCVNHSKFHESKMRTWRLCQLAFGLERILNFLKLSQESDALLISRCEK